MAPSMERARNLARKECCSAAWGRIGSAARRSPGSAPIIDIQTQDRKRKEPSRLLEGRKNGLRAFRENGKTFRPSRRDIGQGQRVQIASLRVLPTMGHQIRFQETGPGILPLLERADGDLLFEQRSGLGGAQSTRSRCPVSVQDAIGGGRAHGEQLASVLLAQVQVSMPL